MQITVGQVADFLRVPERKVYEWIDGGEIPYYRANDQFRFNPAEILEWATERHLPIADSIFRDADEKAVPGLAAALEAGGICHDVPATDRESALRAVIGRMPGLEGLERETLFQVLLARESAGTTAIGEGIAIPHVRSPFVVNGAPVAITLCMLKTPADFSARDGQPVHTIFFIVSPTIRTHLRMLARLASALHDFDFRDAVLKRAPVAEILRQARRLDTASLTTRAREEAT